MFFFLVLWCLSRARLGGWVDYLNRYYFFRIFLGFPRFCSLLCTLSLGFFIFLHFFSLFFQNTVDFPFKKNRLKKHDPDRIKNFLEFVRRGISKFFAHRALNNIRTYVYQFWAKMGTYLVTKNIFSKSPMKMLRKRAKT